MLEVDLSETATYWRASGNDGMGGITWSIGIEIPVAHSDRVEEIRTAEGKKFISDRIYYTEEGLQLGDYITLGEHEGAANPVNAKEIMFVSSNQSMSTLKKVVV